MLNDNFFIRNNLKSYSYNEDKSLGHILNENKFDFFFVSTTQLRKLPILIIIEAFKNKIPIYSTQEVHQMFLHENSINNYLMNVNTLFVSSNFEKNEYIKIGYEEKNEIT